MLGEDKLIDEFQSQLESYLNSTSYHKFIHEDTRHIHSHRKGVHDLNTTEGVEGVLEELRYLEWRNHALFSLAIMMLWYKDDTKLTDDEFLDCLNLIDTVYDNRDEILAEKLKKE